MRTNDSIFYKYVVIVLCFPYISQNYILNFFFWFHIQVWFVGGVMAS